MQKLSLIPAFLIAALFVPFAASAHETQRFEIGGTQYEFVVGSQNEPIVVDDKSGVELRVTRIQNGIERPATGLETSLQVELIAGDARKTLGFVPTYNEPGAYHATFFPTVATTLAYRIFGTINDTPFDYTFTCATGGHAAGEEDVSRVLVSDGVTRVFKTGSFSCPQPKAALGFPEPSADIVSLAEEESDDAANPLVAWGGLALGAIALCVALAYRRS